MLQANMKRTEFGDMNGEDDDAEEERTDLKIQWRYKNYTLNLNFGPIHS